MEIIPQAIPEVLLVKPRCFEDARGYFCETYNEKLSAARGLVTNYVQDNVSLSRNAGTIRGLHFQLPPFAQAKLVRVLRGRILDVAVDVRAGSPSYGRYVAIELSAERQEQLFLPAGFAHGFCTLEDNTEVFYKVNDYYAPAHDSGIVWNDPDLAIAWPYPDDAIILSDKDRALPRFRDMQGAFHYTELKKDCA